jgi:hypothetical protein
MVQRKNCYLLLQRVRFWVCVWFVFIILGTRRKENEILERVFRWSVLQCGVFLHISTMVAFECTYYVIYSLSNWSFKCTWFKFSYRREVTNFVLLVLLDSDTHLYHSIQSGWIMLNISSALLVTGRGNRNNACGNRGSSVRESVTGKGGRIALGKWIRNCNIRANHYTSLVSFEIIIFWETKQTSGKITFISYVAIPRFILLCTRWMRYGRSGLSIRPSVGLLIPNSETNGLTRIEFSTRIMAQHEICIASLVNIS